MSKTMMVCSGGGHLKQLFALSERLGVAPEDQVWLTFENGLSTSLLEDREVHYAPFVAPRDLGNLWRLRSLAAKVMKEHSYDRAFSTGSSPAVAVLPMAASRGASAYYIESAARAEGPSMSGRILEHLRRVHTYTQYPSWQSSRWGYVGSIYDGFAPGRDRSPGPARIRKAVVTVGTQEGYGFGRLYDAIVPLLADCDEVLWQTGSQDVSAWGIDGRDRVPHDELTQAVREADVVIAHSGTGSAITAFEQGRFPILVPRLARYGEHVDDHQVQIAGEMERRGLAFMREPGELDTRTLLEAARRSVTTVDAPPIELAPA
ncbi:glycosyltransferase [Microbacterium ulmi]|uniref:Glycosyl transferase family 28 n=1 Tax=Microbacterium ulmi TaxID=179095 RepID=A0A7Y2M0U3_9MICO|nr:glycosyltransferase [Microbacterium ulmi]NII69458.1 UDP-N-acetylglucosamine transferase subunit ALG13 [Microbacterium ulmi]NNH04416.1 glycosyl transferase family 28 [Microbacterium ulmi]